MCQGPQAQASQAPAVVKIPPKFYNGHEIPVLDNPEDLALLRVRRQELLDARARRDPALDQLPTVAEFYRGRNVLVTGGTGFIGRVVIERLLRLCPDIGKVYVVMRSKRGQGPQERIKDMVNVPLFDLLRSEQPFALEKIVPVHGDCSMLGLGISDEDRVTLERDVSIVIHGAASVRFNDPVKKAVLLNTRGAREVARLAENMKNLKALVHISTAYCFSKYDPLEERVYPTEQDWQMVVAAAERDDSQVLDYLGSRLLDYQPNTYTFSKALAERVMKDYSDHLPIIILRPTIVTAMVRSPLPGWMDNLNGFAGFWAIALKGVLRVSVVGNAHTRFDLVPADVVGDHTLLASWTKGTGQTVSTTSEQPEVVNLSVSDVKPTSYDRMRRMMTSCLAMRVVAYPGAVRYPHFWILENRWLGAFIALFQHLLFGMVIDTCLALANRKPMLMPIYRRFTQAVEALMYFDRAFHFSTGNFWRLQALVHPKDVETYDMDMERDGDFVTMCKDQLMGVLHYAMRERCDDVMAAWRHAQRLFWAEVTGYILLGAFCLWCMVLRGI